MMFSTREPLCRVLSDRSRRALAESEGKQNATILFRLFPHNPVHCLMDAAHFEFGNLLPYRIALLGERSECLVVVV